MEPRASESAEASAPRPSAARRRLVLGALLALSLGVRLVGLGHEIEQRAYLDEGTYYHHAVQILEGEWLTPTFVYPHFLYYLDALVLWLVGLAPAVWGWMASTVWGVDEPVAVAWLALRLATALLSALVVLPVYSLAALLGRSLEGAPGVGARSRGLDPSLAAGVLGGLLVIACPPFNEGSHINISDVPSAVFATACLAFCGRLLVRERLRDYALAGLFAGLAAATKYPAGVVAVAIGAVWLHGRLSRRGKPKTRSSWGLIVAGASALGIFLLSMPSLFVFPQQALFGGRGIFFGVRQYAGGGWLGVLPGSNATYYLGQLWDAFGPALALGLLGLVLSLLRRRSRSRLLWLLPFPAGYLFLVGAMNMVVKRNLFPVLPAAAALLAFGMVALMWSVPRRWRPAPAALLAAAALLLPVLETTRQAAGLARLSTREQAVAWMIEHLPPGATVLGEAYTPSLPPERFEAERRRFAGRFPLENLEDPRRDFLLLSGNAHGRFLRVEDGRREHHDLLARRYRHILDTWTEVATFSPGPARLGPHLALYRVPLPESCPGDLRFDATTLVVPDGSMRPPRPPGPIRGTRPGQWTAGKGCLEAGTYSITLTGSFPEPPRLEARLADGEPLDLAAAAGPWEARFTLQSRAKIFLYAFLTEGSALRAVEVRAVDGG